MEGALNRITLACQGSNIEGAPNEFRRPAGRGCLPAVVADGCAHGLRGEFGPGRSLPGPAHSVWCQERRPRRGPAASSTTPRCGSTPGVLRIESDLQPQPVHGRHLDSCPNNPKGRSARRRTSHAPPTGDQQQRCSWCLRGVTLGVAKPRGEGRQPTVMMHGDLLVEIRAARWCAVAVLEIVRAEGKGRRRRFTGVYLESKTQG